MWTLGGIITNVGNAYQWPEIILSAPAAAPRRLELLNRLAADIEPGSGGLFFLPYLRKVRSPYWDGCLKGAVYGLTADHNLGHMARAMLESIAFDLRSIIALMRHESAVADRVVLTGGLARSPILPQLLADVLGEEVFAPDNAEGSIAGAATLGSRGLARSTASISSAKRIPAEPPPPGRRYGTATTAPTATTCASSRRSGQSMSEEGLATWKSSSPRNPSVGRRDALDLLKDNGVEVVFAAKRTMTTPEIAADIRGYDALIVGNDPVDDTVFAAADRLRLVHMHGTGRL